MCPEISAVLVDLARAISFFLTIFFPINSLQYCFLPPRHDMGGTSFACVPRVLLAACIAFASGLLFRNSTDPAVPLRKTLPVRVLLWALVGNLVLFAFSWYLVVYYVPLARRGHYL